LGGNCIWTCSARQPSGTSLRVKVVESMSDSRPGEKVLKGGLVDGRRHTDARSRPLIPLRPHSPPLHSKGGLERRARTARPASAPQSFLVDPLLGADERASKGVEHLVHLCAVDDQRGAESDRVAGNGAADEAFLLSQLHDLGAEALADIEALLGGLVLDELDAAKQADAARLADERMIAKCFQTRLEHRSDALDVADDVDALVDLERLHRNGAGYGVAGVGEAVRENAELLAL